MSRIVLAVGLPSLVSTVPGKLVAVTVDVALVLVPPRPADRNPSKTPVTLPDPVADVRVTLTHEAKLVPYA